VVEADWVIRTPRRKPERVEEVRISLSDFERDQCRDYKIIHGIRAAAPALAGVAIGAGLVMGAAFFGSSLDEIKETIDEWWINAWKADDATLTRNETAATEVPADGGEADSTYAVLWTMEGMTTAAIYDEVVGQREALISQQWHRWCTATDRAENQESWSFFLGNAHGPLTTCRRVSTTLTQHSIDEGQRISPFTYQLLIRETAARRGAGMAGSVLTGFVTGGVGFIVGPLTWAAGNLFNPNEWTSSRVQDAPGFVSDPLLTLAWGRVDFSGTDAPVPTGTDMRFEGIGSLRTYESDIIEMWTAQQSDPSDLTEWWP